jgi:hypothetical protein
MQLIIEYIQCYWIPFMLGALTMMAWYHRPRRYEVRSFDFENR